MPEAGVMANFPGPQEKESLGRGEWSLIPPSV